MDAFGKEYHFSVQSSFENHSVMVGLQENDLMDK